jgi:hypothetical protein
MQKGASLSRPFLFAAGEPGAVNGAAAREYFRNMEMDPVSSYIHVLHGMSSS